MQKVFIYSDRFESLPYPASCPFNTSRPGLVRKLLDSKGLLTGAGIAEIAPEPATMAQLEQFHTKQYLSALQQAQDGKYSPDIFYMGLGTGDCPIFAGMYDYGALAAGATILGAQKILTGETQIAFNPAGGLHHARANRASGFCYINDQVLGCITLAKAGKKVLYLDVDVHHGDGVQEAFYDRSDVMTVSMHQSGDTLFPGTGFVDEIGTGDGRGFSVNVPLPPETGDHAYMKAFKAVVLPLIEAFAPDVFAMEIGADALEDDPLASLMLTNNLYADIIAELLIFGKPILATGGGGYNIENTVRAWSLAWTALCGAPAKDFRDEPLPISQSQQTAVNQILNITLDQVREKLFPLHSL